MGKRLLSSFLLLISLSLLLQADRYSKSYTIDFPYKIDRNIPRWLSVVREPRLPRYFTSQSFGIRPIANDDSDLAITIYFNEGSGGFLRVYWEGQDSTEMISSNLYDKIGMPNQKTLIIRRSTLSSSGKLVFQTTESTMNIRRIYWEWVKNQSVAVSRDIPLGVAYVDSWGRQHADWEVSGYEPYETGDFWRSSVVNAMLTEKAERIEEGTEFIFQIENKVNLARLDLQIAGLAPQEKIGLWVNDKYVGEIAVEVPDLVDPGYQLDESGQLIYVGWRKGSYFLEANHLQLGENRLQLGRLTPSPNSIAQPLAIKNTILQIKYVPTTSNPLPNMKNEMPFRINPQLYR